METVNALLNLPGSAGSSERALALSELLHEYEDIQAAYKAAETELGELREATVELFVETIAAARGIEEEEALQAAADLWLEDSTQAAALLSADIVTAANPYGCNQYGEGWKEAHNGLKSTPGHPVRKSPKFTVNWNNQHGKPGKQKAQSKTEQGSKLKQDVQKTREAYKQAEKEYDEARKKALAVEDDIENAYNEGDDDKAEKLERKASRLRAEERRKQREFDAAEKEYSDASDRYKESGNQESDVTLYDPWENQTQLIKNRDRAQENYNTWSDKVQHLVREEARLMKREERLNYKEKDRYRKVQKDLKEAREREKEAAEQLRKISSAIKNGK